MLVVKSLVLFGTDALYTEATVVFSTDQTAVFKTSRPFTNNFHSVSTQIDEVNLGVLGQGLIPTAWELFKRRFAVLIQIDEMPGAFVAGGVASFIRIYGMLGDVFDVLLVKGNQFSRQGKYRQAINAAVAEEAPLGFWFGLGRRST